MAEGLCRNGRHPYSHRQTRADGRADCTDCRREERTARNASRPGGRDGWGDPVADRAAVARLAAWQAGVEASIAEMRAREGFDGQQRVWRTLGDVVGMRGVVIAPAPARRRAVTRMVVTCRAWGTPKLWDQPCATCLLRRAARDAERRAG